jgi:WD40 repeat protein
MLPGSSPFKELVEALRRIAVDDIGEVAESLFDGRVTLDEVVSNAVPGGERVLLVVDQLEELFTLTPDAEQGRFLDCLADAVQHPGGRLHVVATLRADFYDRPLAFQRFGALVHDATVAVPAMAPSSLEAAIVRPLEAIGARAEPALVAEMIAAVADQPAALPSLQFTLFELAQRRADRCPTLEDYRNLGGVAAAIASRAENLYLSLDEAGRGATRNLFERLVVFGAEGEATSRRSHRSSLANGDQAVEVEAVIDRWTAARLLTADVDPRTRVPVVQVAHEALLGTWPRLREWLEQDRDAILALNHLQEASASWVELGREDGALYRGLRLQAALELAEVRSDEMTTEEREFVAASSALRRREEAAAADHLRRQERANRRLRVQFAVIAAALVVALVVGALAVSQRSNAVAQRRVAVGRELAAASITSLDDDPERSILLALEAVDKTRSGDDGSALPEAEDALRRAVAASRVLVTVPGVGGRLDWSPTDDVFVTEGIEESGIVDIRDASTGESVRTFRGDDVDINDVRFNADGSKLVVTGDDGTAGVWDPETGEELVTIVGEGPAWYPAFSADSRLVATYWLKEDIIRVNDTTSGDVVAELPGGGTGDVDLSPDGNQLAVTNGDGAAIVDVATGETGMLEGAEGNIGQVAWSPSGDRIATGAFDGDVRVWDAATGQQMAAGFADDAPITGLDWSADGTRLASGGNDGTARVWHVDGNTITEILRFAAQDLSNGVPGVAFSPEGDRLVAADWQITSAKIFDLRPERTAEVAGWQTPEGSFTMQFTADGSGLVTSVDDGIVGTWNVNDGTRRSTLEGLQSPGFVVSPDGDVVAAASQSGFPISLRDMTTGDELASFNVRDGGLDVIAWSPDGSLIGVAHGEEEGSVVTILDRSLNVLARMDQPGFFVSDISLHADNTRVAIARSGRDRFDPVKDRAVVWDWERDEVVLELDAVATLVKFDPSSDRLAAVLFNTSSPVVWDASTGERLGELAGHTGLINELGFSADGSRIVTVSDDRTARVWMVATGEQLAVLRSDALPVGVAIDASGSKLATVDQAGVVRISALDLDELVDIATARVTRGLTDAECQQYLHRDRCAA